MTASIISGPGAPKPRKPKADAGHKELRATDAAYQHLNAIDGIAHVAACAALADKAELTPGRLHNAMHAIVEHADELRKALEVLDAARMARSAT